MYNTMYNTQRGSSPMMKRSLMYADKTTFNSTTSMLSKSDIIVTSLFALAITVAAMVATVYLGFINPSLTGVISMMSCGATLILGFIVFFTKKNTSSPFWTILFAALQGITIGGFTFFIGIQTLNNGTSGWELVSQAVIGSVTVFFLSFMLYACNIVRPSDRMRSILSVVFLGFLATYAVNFLITLFFGKNLLMSEGPLPIIIAIAAIIFGALRVITDIQDCDYAIQSNMPQKTRWQLASSIVSSLIWLYTEILRLLYLVSRR